MASIAGYLAEAKERPEGQLVRLLVKEALIDKGKMPSEKKKGGERPSGGSPAMRGRRGSGRKDRSIRTFVQRKKRRGGF